MIKELIKFKEIKSRSIVFFFLAIIYAPLIAGFLNIGVTNDKLISDSELRQSAKYPSLRLLITHPPEYLRGIQDYYDDHFGFRKTLIGWYSIVKVLWWNESSFTKVIIGKKGWFFLRNDGGNDELSYYRSTKLCTPKELAAWKSALEQRNDWLASKGIHYLLVIAPNKSTIYPEFLPQSVNRVREESRLDQLIVYMKATNSRVNILDLRGSLRAAKSSEQIYDLKDTHWNDLGAFIAYQQIMKSISIWYPYIKALPRSKFKLKMTARDGDLIGMVGLKHLIKDRSISLISRTPSLVAKADPGIYKPDVPEPQQPFATELQDSSLPKAVMFRDSFTERLAPFLSENFRRILYLWQDEFDKHIVQKEHPDIVIQEIVERKLMGRGWTVNRQ